MAGSGHHRPPEMPPPMDPATTPLPSSAPANHRALPQQFPAAPMHLPTPTNHLQHRRRDLLPLLSALFFTGGKRVSTPLPPTTPSTPAHRHPMRPAPPRLPRTLQLFLSPSTSARDVVSGGQPRRPKRQCSL